ncbi:lysine biosynthesis protein LysX [Sulfolobus acidocaldarius]|uniref:lysine biosynthesis protein LysX n=1 Tax=Sulfolobus acidocaldarius TaxID=2285 RepID=UPI000785373A|nr:lysine biosynthesis protein LysX [Sulfolobus acidocaldarius]
MIIGVSYDLLRWEEKDIITEAKKSGFKAIPIFTKDFYSAIGVGENYSELEADVIIQRNTSHARALTTSLIFEGWNYNVVNDATSLFKCGNKLYTLSLLAKHNIKTPRTIVTFSCLLYTSDAALGDVYKRQDEDILYSFLEYQEYTTSQFRQIYLVQEFVKKPNRDIRIFVMGDEAPVGIYRVNERNWKTNTALGARALPLKIDDELRDLALKVRDIMGGFFLGIDIFEDPERGYLVNEVNGVPEYKNTVRVNNFNVSSYLLNKLREWIKK